jgi:hypothetical protein
MSNKMHNYAVGAGISFLNRTPSREQERLSLRASPLGMYVRTARRGTN